MTYKVALVTGASSGIGKAIAVQLCTGKVKVYGVARDIRKLNDVRKTLPTDIRKQFIPLVCDVSDRQSVINVLDEVFAKNEVDLIINNAGIGFSRDFSKYTNAEIDAVIATNLQGVVSVTRTALKARKIDQFLQIVNVTSLAGKMGFPQMSIYSASKFAIEGFTEALRHEYQGKNVSFTILRPGITDTAFFGKAGMETYKQSVNNLKVYYSPEKVATVFLKKLNRRRKTIVVGNDKIFITLLPFIPFNARFKVLDIINKL